VGATRRARGKRRHVAAVQKVQTPAADWKACPTLLGDESLVFSFEIQVKNTTRDFRAADLSALPPLSAMRSRILGPDSEKAKPARRATCTRAALISLPIFALTWGGQLAFSEESLKQDLVQQQERLNRETSAVGKVKALIKISDIHLRSAGQAVKKGDLGAADRNLELYKESVNHALETLKSSRRNAQKNPAGFKEFEISLRKQLRVLDDLRSHYSFDRVQTIDAAIAAAKAAQDAMFAEIFGPENTGRRREKDSSRHPSQPKE